MKVLICDGSKKCQKLLGECLTEMGHMPIYANDTEKALALFLEHQPELIFIDMEMETMDGYETTRFIRQCCHDFSQWTPIVFMSSQIDNESVIKGIEVGGDDYLIKPISPAMLKAKIHAMRRIVLMRESLMDFGKQLRDVNERLLSSNQLLSELSLKDPLTRLGNRRSFEENLLQIARVAMREFKPLSLLMIDVDNFKEYNDTYGHQAGDHCLQQIGQVLMRGVHRAQDTGARYGGEEFAVILADTPLPGGMYVAERIRMGVESLRIPNKNAPLGIVTVTIGVASSRADLEFCTESLVAAADSALYSGKQTGRNCVVGSKVVVDTQKPESILHYNTQRFLSSSSSGSSSKH